MSSADHDEDEDLEEGASGVGKALEKAKSKVQHFVCVLRGIVQYCVYCAYRDAEFVLLVMDETHTSTSTSISIK